MANENRNSVSGAKPAKRADDGSLLEQEQVIPQKSKDMARVSSAKPTKQLGFSKDARTKTFHMVEEIKKAADIWLIDTESKEALASMITRIENAVKEIKKQL